MEVKDTRRAWVGISEICEKYLPISKKKARKFAIKYLNPIWVGNTIFVERDKFEKLLHDFDSERFPLDD